MADARQPRSAWFATASGGRRRRRGAPTPIEAQRLIDAALSSLGIDADLVTDQAGWRHIGAGSAFGMINVVEWEPGQHFVVIWSPMMQAPTDMALRARLFGVLLTLNHYETGVARFSLIDDWVMMTAARPIDGLDEGEVLDLIQMVLQTADRLDDPLQEAFTIAMPAVPIEPSAQAAVLDLLQLSSRRARQVFRRLIEGWIARGGALQGGGNRVLLARPGERGLVLAELLATASGESTIRLPWDALEAQWSISTEAAEAFRSAIPRPAGFQIIAGLAQLVVHSGFTDAVVDDLLAALVGIDEALRTVSGLPASAQEESSVPGSTAPYGEIPDGD